MKRTLIGLIIFYYLFFLIKGSNDVQDRIIESFIDGPSKELFKIYHFIFKKEYELDSSDGINRYKIFKKNLMIIKENNSKDLPYKLGINQFADLSSEEFTEKYLMKEGEFQKTLENSVRNLREEGYFDKWADKEDFEIPEETHEQSNFTPVDWSKLFGPIRNQGTCGSCWAYAVTGIVEAAWARKNNRISAYLSTQQLVDCDFSNYGCYGGDTNLALKYIQNYGLVSDSSYPYKGVKSTCSIPNTVRTKFTSYTYCMNGNYYYPCKESLIYSRLSGLGPQATAIDGTAIQLYKSGIFTASCSTRNHAVILVGYGSQLINGVTYNFWKIRNSWSSYWGESGYIRVYANENNSNSCYVTSQSFSVTP
jgi:C1A family cysteine protease